MVNVYSVFVPMTPVPHGKCILGVCPHDFAVGSIVSVVPTMYPAVEFTGSSRREKGNLLWGNRHIEMRGVV
jgi:hypothetical protein